jgi:hypothetical protein
MERVLARPKSELAGKTVKLVLKTANHQDIDGKEFHVEDWYQNCNGDKTTHWTNLETWAERNYAERIQNSKVPRDSDVLYGKVGRYGYLIHITEINGEETNDNKNSN